MLTDVGNCSDSYSDNLCPNNVSLSASIDKKQLNLDLTELCIDGDISAEVIDVYNGEFTCVEKFDQSFYIQAAEAVITDVLGQNITGSEVITTHKNIHVLCFPIYLETESKSALKGYFVVCAEGSCDCKVLTKTCRILASHYSRQISESFAKSCILRENHGYSKACNNVVSGKDQFIRNISHELRTPLTSVIGFAEMLIDDTDEPLSDRQRMQVERIASNGHILLRLVNNVMDLSKIDANKVTIELSKIEIRKFFEQVLDSLSSLIIGKDIVTVLNIDDVDEIISDSQLLGQIMINLISNAIKFTDKGSITIGVANNVDSVIIYVEDTGIGIPVEEQNVIFNEFHQVKKQRSGQRGTGLGLAIASKLTSLLGGEICVESTVGVGSKFILKLPQPGPTHTDLFCD